LAQYNNGLVRLTINNTGLPTEALYFTGPSGVEQVVYNDRLNTGTSPAAFYIYDDVPLFWDAWDCMDYHLETRQLPNYDVQPAFQSFAAGPIVGGAKWTANFGNGSTIVRYAIMRANSPMVEYYVIVDWKESHKFLKVEFPVDILSREATYEIQYGHAKRPTHINTSWDMAKFEVCGHKWMDISQSGKGVTFITDSKYGWHVRDNIVKLSLLRSPKNPDGNCDMHRHFIYYAVMPHEGTFQEADVIRKAYELNYFGSNNVPILPTGLTTTLPQNWVQVEHPSIIVEAFKVAHESTQDTRALVVRLYESHGGSATTRINLGFAITRVNECNGLEKVGEVIPNQGNSFQATFTPFKIRSFFLTLAN
jgi:alpha-mannosidase